MIHLHSVQDNESYTDRKVFDRDFKVDEMSNPSKYLIEYQKNNLRYETSCVEDCQIGCGNICMGCAMCLAPLGCCCCTNCCCCYQLGTSMTGLVESFGRFSRLLKPGLNLINPCSEEVRVVDMRIRVLDVSKQITMTKDNVKLTIDSSVAFRVTNPVLSFYVIGSNENRALHESTTSAIRQVIAEYTLDKVLSARMQIASRSKERVLKTIPSGITVENIFIEEIAVPREMERDLTAAARQKRISEANIINSQADVETASLMKQSAELLDTKTAMQIRYLEMVEELGKRGVTLMMGIGVNKKGFKI